ncbi:MAG: hypothetical protein WCG52_09165 [bacterium]
MCRCARYTNQACPKKLIEINLRLEYLLTELDGLGRTAITTNLWRCMRPCRHLMITLSPIAAMRKSSSESSAKTVAVNTSPYCANANYPSKFVNSLKPHGSDVILKEVPMLIELHYHRRGWV